MSILEQKKFELVSSFTPSGDQSTAITSLLDGLDKNLQYQTLLGVTGSGKTFTMASIIAKTNRPAIIFAHNKTLAAQLYGEFKHFFPNNRVEYFVSYYDYYQPEAYIPTSDSYIAKESSINDHIEQMRLSATKSLLTRTDTIVIASVSSIYGIGSDDNYIEACLQLRVNEPMDRELVLAKLVGMQYTRTNAAITRGQFRVKGDVIDIFPADEENNIIRLEIFDDVLERIAWLDPLTNKTLFNENKLTIFPKTHYVVARSKILAIVEDIKDELKLRLDELEKANKLVEYQRLKERVNYDIEMLVETGVCSGIENYSRYLSGKKTGEPPYTMLDYMPRNALMFVDESHISIPQIRGMYNGDRARKTTLVEYGFRLPSAMDNRPLRFEEWEEKAPTNIIFVSATPAEFEAEHSKNIAEQLIRPTGIPDPIIEIRPASNQVEDVFNLIKETIPKNERILITVLTKKLAEKLTTFLENKGIKVAYIHADVNSIERMEIIQDLRSGRYDVLIGINLLREGLDMPEVSHVCILDADQEGFLRSKRSLIQTIGRAARNIHGKAILYADRITQAMKDAIEETDRRREKQIAFNTANNITPTALIKPITDIMESKKNKPSSGKTKEILPTHWQTLSAGELGNITSKLEKEMLKLAEKLEFEKATKYRESIKLIKEFLLLNG